MSIIRSTWIGSDRWLPRGRVEIIGGAFYEPILTMIPSRDRLGQIETYSHWLENRLGGAVRGMWIPERVWEQSLTSDVSRAGIEYTVLDDFHFRNAGLSEEQLHGYYVTEDDGRTLNIFPGSERLRYLIPFRDPQETIEYLRGVAEQHPQAVAVFGDDGEKFGTWPETNKHCYHDGWLRRFFDALAANRDWLKTTTLADAVERVPPLGKIYLPDCSYREMTEWALPVAQQLAYDSAVHDLEHDPRWPRIKPFVRGGFWRNFKVKYPEANEMYSRMMMVSRRLEQAQREGVGGETRGVGAPRVVPRPVQLQLLARGVWRDLSAALAERRLQPPDRRRQPAGQGEFQRAQQWARRSDGGRLQLRRPAGNPLAERQAGRPAGAGGGRPDVRTGRPLDLPQSAGHAVPPARGLSPQGVGRPIGQTGTTAPASTIAWSSNRPVWIAAALRPLSAQEPDRSLLRQRRAIAGGG